MIKRILTIGWNVLLLGPVWLLAVGLAVKYVARWSQVRAQARILVTVAGTGMLIELALYPAFLDVSLVLVCSVLAAVLIQEPPALAKSALLANVIVAMALAPHVGYVALRFLGPVRESAAYDAQVLRSVAGAESLAVDEIAARYVFDYRLPSRVVYWNYSVPPQQYWPKSLAERPAGTVWVLSQAKGPPVTGLPATPYLRLFGHSFTSIPKRPGLMAVIR
jgi:hypothetical protein